ncbi:MAG: FUSC family protein [Brevinematales bacterium]|jgi:uncharacterized membrane protein YccC
MPAAKLRKLTSEFLSKLREKDFILYLVKCLLGSSLCYLLYVLFPGFQFSWSIISILLVLAPDHNDSIKLAVDRIRANIIGAFIGLAAFFLPIPGIFTLWIAILATIFFCTFIKLGNATRTALAALIIVLLQENEKNDWRLGLERMGAVATGSLFALVLTIAFRKLQTKTPGKGKGRHGGGKAIPGGE